MPSVFDGLIPRDPEARRVAEERATAVVRALAPVAADFAREWIAGEREAIQAERAALAEYARAAGVEAPTGKRPELSEPVERDSWGRPIVEGTFEENEDADTK